jgi:N-acetylmuramoyl-L-alanine amidase
MNAPSSQNPPANPKASKRPPRSGYGLWRTLQTIFSVGLLVATLLTFWTPANLFSSNLLERMLVSAQASKSLPEDQSTPTASPRPKIGIVAGHWGNDSGSVCQDGLTEEEVNLKIAQIVLETLKRDGFDVDLLKEKDSRLNGYRAVVLVSIHNDSCNYINDLATGFKVAAAQASAYPEKATRLTACLSQRYAQATGLTFHYNSVTPDMTDYHTFREINPDTTAAIIETGFLNLDREILTQHTDKVAQGVSDGILCYVRNEDVAPTPVSSDP